MSLRPFISTIVSLIALAGCSRARVESMNFMNQGVELAQQNQALSAIEKFERANAVDPSNDQALWNLAIVHMQLQKYERAKDDLQRAIALQPTSAGYQEKLGTVLIELKDWARAKEALETTVKIDPTLFKAHYKLGQVFEHLDDEQHALYSYTEAIRRGPRFLEAYAALGRLYADLGFLDQAVQVLQSALQVAQKDSEEEASVHHLLGTVYQQQKKFGDAVTEFKQALRIVPSMRDALFSLGWTYVLENDRTEAKRYLKKFVDVAQGQAPAHYVQAAKDKLAELSEAP